MLPVHVNAIVRAHAAHAFAFQYQKDCYALSLLAHVIGGGRPISALRKGPFSRLLEKPSVEVQSNYSEDSGPNVVRPGDPQVPRLSVRFADQTREAGKTLTHNATTPTPQLRKVALGQLQKTTGRTVAFDDAASDEQRIRQVYTLRGQLLPASPATMPAK